MEVIVLSKGRFEPVTEQLNNFLSKSAEYRETIYSQQKTGIFIESKSRVELPCCVLFHADTADEGCALGSALRSTLRIDIEQVFIEITKGIYYSGALAMEQWNYRWLDPSTRPPFRYLSSCDFRKAIIFEKGERVIQKNLPAGFRADDLLPEFPDADKLIEVWCKEWEYYDKYLFSFGFDYGDECFWACNRKANENFDYGSKADQFPLSEKTRLRVWELGRLYRTCLDWSNPGGESPWSEDDWILFNKTESLLVEDIRKELGVDYEILLDR